MNTNGEGNARLVPYALAPQVFMGGRHEAGHDGFILIADSAPAD